jgi:hypothetical protein
MAIYSLSVSRSKYNINVPGCANSMKPAKIYCAKIKSAAKVAAAFQYFNILRALVSS